MLRQSRRPYQETAANMYCYDYQLSFEKLQNTVVGVPDHVLLELYVPGLKQPIQDEVLLHRPATLAAAFALAVQIVSCRPEWNQPPYPPFHDTNGNRETPGNH